MAAIGLRFMTSDGSFINVIVEDNTAQQVLTWMANKMMPPTLGSFNVPSLKPSPLWCLDSSKLFAIHTFSLEGMNQGQLQGGYNPAFGRSGM